MIVVCIPSPSGGKCYCCGLITGGAGEIRYHEIVTTSEHVHKMIAVCQLCDSTLYHKEKNIA